MTHPRAAAVAIPLAVFFVVVQFYTSLQALSPTPQVGFSFAGRAGAAVLVTLLALSSLACAAALLRERALWAPSPSRTILTAWIGAALLGSVFGIDPLSGVQVVATMLLGAFFHLALVRYYRRAPVARMLLVAYFAVGAAAAAAGIAMALAHVPAGLYAVTQGRAAGFFVTSNEFGEYLDIFVFVALGALLGSRDPLVRGLAAAGALLGAVALVLTFSREALAGAGAAAVFFAFASGRRRAGFGVLAVAALAAAVLVFRPFPHHDPSDTFSRLRTVQSGLRVASLFPLTGVGPVAYWRVYPAVRPVNGAEPGTFAALHPHDIYVSLAGELGVAGLAAAVFGWFRFAADVRLRLARGPGGQRSLAIGVCAGLIALAVSGLTDTIGVVQMTFVWIPYSALALAASEAAA